MRPIQGVILVPEALISQRLHVHYQLLGHRFKTASFRVKNLLSHKYHKNKSKSHIPTFIKVATQALPGRSSPSGVTDITDSDQDTHFASQTTQCWAPRRGSQLSFTAPKSWLNQRIVISFNNSFSNSSLTNKSPNRPLSLPLALIQGSLAYLQHTNFRNVPLPFATLKGNMASLCAHQDRLYRRPRTLPSLRLRMELAITPRGWR